MKVLWIDDDLFSIRHAVERLEDNGHSAKTACGVWEALHILEKNQFQFDLILVDVMMPNDSELFDEIDTHGGFHTGIALAKKIKKEKPNMKIVGCSLMNSSEVRNWFEEYCDGYIYKYDILGISLVRKLENIVYGKFAPRIFIVHGHDSNLLLELKNFLQNKLRFPEPIILREQPSLGKTIIEKFEHYSNDIDLVIVLLTPDDVVNYENDSCNRRTRQNVIFELGYFYGKLLRTSGKVILIHKGPLEIPSDISGIMYMQIENDFKSITEELRNEIDKLRIKNNSKDD